MTAVASLFPSSYEESRARFRRDLDLVRRTWPNARLAHHPLRRGEDLTIDWIEAEGLERNDKLLVFTTGEHGIEGYVGSAMLQLVIDEFLPRLTADDTGLVLVHAINPWGMKHERRTDSRNVDLNRNFVWGRSAFDRSINPDYVPLDRLLNPKGPVRSLSLGMIPFLLKLLWHLVLLGPERVRRATLMGQYRFPKGVYYGGGSLQEETGVMMDLYRTQMRKHKQIVLLDMHTGFGPRYQMSVVNSAWEPRGSHALERQFSYPLVVKASSLENDGTRGDMIDYVYRLARREFPDRRPYAASFEFGTAGNSRAALLRSLRAIIWENQTHWFGAKDQEVRERIAGEFRELFVPQEDEWRAKAVSDARQALYGILRTEGFIA